MIISTIEHVVLIVLSVAYIVEWRLGRVNLKQSLIDIKLVWKQTRGRFKAWRDRFRKPKTGP